MSAQPHNPLHGDHARARYSTSWWRTSSWPELGRKPGEHPLLHDRSQHPLEAEVPPAYAVGAQKCRDFYLLPCCASRSGATRWPCGRALASLRSVRVIISRGGTWGRGARPRQRLLDGPRGQRRHHRVAGGVRVEATGRRAPAAWSLVLVHSLAARQGRAGRVPVARHGRDRRHRHPVLRAPRAGSLERRAPMPDGSGPSADSRAVEVDRPGSTRRGSATGRVRGEQGKRNEVVLGGSGCREASRRRIRSGRPPGACRLQRDPRYLGLRFDNGVEHNHDTSDVRVVMMRHISKRATPGVAGQGFILQGSRTNESSSVRRPPRCVVSLQPPSQRLLGALRDVLTRIGERLASRTTGELRQRLPAFLRHDGRVPRPVSPPPPVALLLESLPI